MKLEKIARKMFAPTLSFAMGLGLGKLGKATNNEWLVLIPPAMDLFGGLHVSHIVPYLSYGAGFAMNYLPEIYNAINNLK